MKAGLIFDLENSDDQLKYEHCLRAEDYFLALAEIDLYLRNQIEYSARLEGEDETLQEVRDRLHEILNENNIEL